MSLQIPRKAVLSFSSNIIITLFGLISLIFVKRYYGFELLGMIAFSISYVSLFALVSDLGLSVSHRKIVNEVKSDEGLCNGTFLASKFALNIFMLFLVLLSYPIFENFISESNNKSLFRILFFLFLFNTFVINIASSFKVIFNAKLEIATSTIPRVIFRFFQMLLKVGVCVVGLSIIYIGIVEVFIALCILFTFIYFFRNKSIKYPTKDKIKEYFSFGIPITAISLLTIVNENLDRLMIQYFVSTEEVGIYYLPYILAKPFILIPAAVVVVIFPVLSRQISSRKLDDSNKLSNLSVKYISLLILPILMIEFIFSNEILILLFGKDAIASSNILRYFILGFYILAIRDPYRLQIISSGKLKYLVIITSFALLTNFCLNIILIPSYYLNLPVANLGAEGAALSTAFSYFILAFLSSFYANKVTGITVYPYYWKHIVASIYALFFGYLIQLQFTGPVAILIGSIVIILFFIIVLIILKEIDSKDINLFKNALSLNKMYNYVSDEVQK